MKKFSAVVVLAFLCHGCNNLISDSSQTNPKASPSALASTLPKLGEVPVETDTDLYSEVMSSRFGIGLTPQFTLNRSPDTVIFRWKTDYGFFLSQDLSTFKINELGKQVDYNEKKIYWSYSSSTEPDITKKEINVVLDVLDKSSGSLITSTKINFEWNNQGFSKRK